MSLAKGPSGNMEYNKHDLLTYVEDFTQEHRKHLEQLKMVGRPLRLFEEIPMTVKAIAAQGYFMNLGLTRRDFELLLAQFLNNEFPDSIDPEVPAAIEYARQYWVWVSGY